MSFACSSRTILPSRSLSLLGSTRGVLHRARPPLRPILRSPHNPKQPNPSSGTSHPVPSMTDAPVLTTSAALEDMGLTFHHSPPPTAPSYKTGTVPDLLRWVNGGEVKLTGEETASAAQVGGEKVWNEEKVQWSDEVVRQMKEMRAMGLSRKKIADSLSIPLSQQYLIPRIATLSPAQAAAKKEELEQQKSKWGYTKKLARAVRQKRKEFW